MITGLPDKDVGIILDKLKELGIDENTLGDIYHRQWW